MNVRDYPRAAFGTDEASVAAVVDVIDADTSFDFHALQQPSSVLIMSLGNDPDDRQPFCFLLGHRCDQTTSHRKSRDTYLTPIGCKPSFYGKGYNLPLR